MVLTYLQDSQHVFKVTHSVTVFVLQNYILRSLGLTPLNLDFGVNSVSHLTKGPHGGIGMAGGRGGSSEFECFP